MHTCKYSNMCERPSGLHGHLDFENFQHFGSPGIFVNHINMYLYISWGGSIHMYIYIHARQVPRTSFRTRPPPDAATCPKSNVRHPSPGGGLCCGILSGDSTSKRPALPHLKTGSPQSSSTYAACYWSAKLLDEGVAIRNVFHALAGCSPPAALRLPPA